MIRVLELREDDRKVRGFVAYDDRANQLLSERFGSAEEAEAYCGWVSQRSLLLPLPDLMRAWRNERLGVMV